MGVILIGGTSGASADVDATPKAARGILYDHLGNVLTTSDKAALPTIPTGIPFLAKQRDKVGRILRCSPGGSLAVLSDELLLSDLIEGAAVNTNLWTQSLSTFTVVQATHAQTFNAGASTTSGAFAIHTSNRQFPLAARVPLKYRLRARFNHVNNAVIEAGFGAPAGVTVVINDGCFFRKTTAGQLQAVVSFNGTETTFNLGAITTTDFYLFEITVFEDYAQFVVMATDGTVISDTALAIPITQAFIWSVTHLPAFERIYNNTAPATAPTLVVGGVMIEMLDVDMNKGWSEQLAGATKDATRNPLTTFAQLANWTNSTEPVSATLSNTAAGYTTLGGQWQYAAVAGAVTDFALFGFQNPTPYQLYITQIMITAMLQGAAIATTGTLMQWGAAFNSSAVSLATAGTYPPIRITLGTMSYVVADAIGSAARGGPIIWTPKTPAVIEPGRFLHIILRIPVATATAAQIHRGTCLIEGYFE